MFKPLSRKFVRFVLKHRLLLLLINTFLLIVIFPILENYAADYLVIIELLFNALLLVGIYLVTQNKQIVAVSSLLSILAIVVIMFDRQIDSKILLIFGLGCEITVFIIAFVRIISHVLKYRRISEDKIYGAMSAYLLLGIIWAMLYTIVELAFSNSFYFAHGFILNQELSAHLFYFSQFLYASFVTLSTLGYGDIVPISGLARVMTSLEAISGQLYVAVLIARLVGVHISQQSNSNKLD